MIAGWLISWVIEWLIYFLQWFVLAWLIYWSVRGLSNSPIYYIFTCIFTFFLISFKTIWIDLDILSLLGIFLTFVITPDVPVHHITANVLQANGYPAIVTISSNQMFSLNRWINHGELSYNKLFLFKYLCQLYLQNQGQNCLRFDELWIYRIDFHHEMLKLTRPLPAGGTCGVADIIRDVLSLLVGFGLVIVWTWVWFQQNTAGWVIEDNWTSSLYFSPNSVAIASKMLVVQYQIMIRPSKPYYCTLTFWLILPII